MYLNVLDISTIMLYTNLVRGANFAGGGANFTGVGAQILRG